MGYEGRSRDSRTETSCSKANADGHGNSKLSLIRMGGVPRFQATLHAEAGSSGSEPTFIRWAAFISITPAIFASAESPAYRIGDAQPARCVPIAWRCQQGAGPLAPGRAATLPLHSSRVGWQ